MNYQFEMTSWISTVIDKNTPIPRNIIMKIQNTGDKEWMLQLLKRNKQTNEHPHCSYRKVRMALDLTILKTSAQGAMLSKMWRDIISSLNSIPSQTIKQHEDGKKSHFQTCKVSINFAFLELLVRNVLDDVLHQNGKVHQDRGDLGMGITGWWWRKSPVWAQFSRKMVIGLGRTSVNQGPGTLTAFRITPLSSHHLFA